MEGFAIILVILGVAALILPWINLFRLNGLFAEVTRLKFELRELSAELEAVRAAPQRTVSAHAVSLPSSVPLTSPSAIVQDQPAENPPAMKTAVESGGDDFDWDDGDTQPVAKQADQHITANEDFDWGEEAEQVAAKPRKVIQYNTTDLPVASSGLEFNLSTKLTVWIGAASVALAVFYLVQYSITQGLLEPPVRIVLGLLFGLVLSIGGYWAHERGRFSNNVRVGQGITGAGLVALTFSLYSATNMYHLITPFTGFIGMAAVVASTAILSLRMGPPIAAFAIVGGFAAPVLFATNTPNYVALFTYLLILSSGLQYIVVRQKWWGLSVASLVIAFLWAVLITLNGLSSDLGWVVCLYVLGLSSVTAVLNMIYPDDQPCDNFEFTRSQFSTLLGLALGGIMLLAIYNQIGFGVYEWTMNGLMTGMIMLLAYLRPKPYTPALYGKAGLDVLLAVAYFDQTPDRILPLLVLLGGMAIYGGVPSFISRTLGQIKVNPWVIIQALGMIGVYVAGITHTSLFPPEIISIHGWGIAGLLGSAYFIKETAYWHNTGNKLSVAFTSIAATSFLTIGLVYELPADYIGGVFALEAAALIWLSSRLSMDFLIKIAYALTAIFGVTMLPHVLEHLSRIVDSILASPKGIAAEQLKVSDMISVYVIPSLAFITGFAFYSKSVTKLNAFHHILFAVPVLSGIGLLYLVMSALLLQDGMIRTAPFGFIERGVFSLVIASFAALLIGIAQTCKSELVKEVSALWGKLVLLLALMRIVFFDMIIYFPMEHGEQEVGVLMIFNGVTLTYGLGLALAMSARRLKIGIEEHPWMNTAYKILSLLFLLTLESLTVRQAFHGNVLYTSWREPMDNVELYAYSVVWLLSGLALLAYGIRKSDKSLRLAALVFIALTIGKVFLIDAANLEGLYRVFSFLGLGVSLIGLSVFTTRYMDRLTNEQK